VRVQVLDMRLGNTDRNGGNILVRRTAEGSIELVPIDHGCCFPSTFQDISFEWLCWPQARVPFDAETLSHIEQLDADADLALLAAHGLVLRAECERVFKASSRPFFTKLESAFPWCACAMVTTRRSFQAWLQDLHVQQSVVASFMKLTVSTKRMPTCWGCGARCLSFCRDLLELWNGCVEQDFGLLLGLRQVCTMLLKMGAAAGMSAFDIGSMMSREALTKSVLEKLHSRARKMAIDEERGVTTPAAVHYCSTGEESYLNPKQYLRHMHVLLAEYIDEAHKNS
jgi:Phosphatidylinositol 3- and 4-kinase